MGSGNAAGYSATMVKHFLHGYGKRVFVTQHNHAKRVADQNAIYSGTIQGNRGWIIVCRQKGDWLPMHLF
jgi:hypothetical protein